MKNIKVKTLFGSWQGYQEIANYPPQGIEYLGISKKTSQGKYYESKKIKEFASRVLQKIKIPRIIFVKPGNYDLIHSSRGIIPLNRKSWVMDVEHVFSFAGLDPDLLQKKGVKKFIEKRLSKKNCKALLCHCEASRKSFLRYLNCEKFKDKLKVLYPASHIPQLKKEKHPGIRILVVLSLFEQKGGIQILEAFSRLEKKYKNIELWIRANVPERVKRKYNSKQIKYIDYSSNILPRDELLRENYSKCDIFVYPTFCDSFGSSLIDALVAGLPIVSTNLFAVPEVVENGKNGLIVNIPKYSMKDALQRHSIKNMGKEDEEQFTKNLSEAIEKLIKNKKLRDNMGKESFKKVEKGKFSIEQRNKELNKIYLEAIK